MASVEQPMLTREHFGRELRRFRELAGLTQVQLAARLGYDHTYLSKLESGARAPRIAFARQADHLLNAAGALLRLATGGTAIGVSAPGGLPLPSTPPGAGTAPSPPVRRIDLPAFGVTCPLHDTEGCSVPVPATGLAELLLVKGRVPTADTDTLHGFAVLLTTYLKADAEVLTGDLSVPVERALRGLVELIPRARGAVSAGLLRLAAQYADLAGWLRVKRGQHGVGMMWLQRAVEWAMAAGNFATASEVMTNMSVLAWLEGDAATALEHSRAAAEVDRGRRWTVVQAKLYQARGHALLGDGEGFTTQAGEARRMAERLGDRDRIEAPWLFGAEGETFIASHLAGALRDLADTTGDRTMAARAVRFAETALETLPTRMHPSRPLLTLRLADSHACTGDLDAAIALARPVMPAVRSAGNTLLRKELARLRARLAGRSDALSYGPGRST
ncbi:helix-turn-helix domain-containing protein [Amycolatopsis suaedae]|uniref:Helix-turn-helix domain-containing protein n=1 Tax=Amycolatopsis suaedae TaxID=2510978 RepID=A0A4Q7J3E9_9PSEU|nr:helix-turn-helix transcriptional regulator [Amycolatopsis suaedae]RZQ61499.1 helix-turn-helix domain-containing protein [Amycolatopsis suaedae]